MTNAKYAKLTVGLIVVWFLSSFAVSALHLFSTNPGKPPLLFGLAVLIPIGIFVVWSATSEPFRQFLLSLDLRALTIVQSWRVAGFTFLALYTYSILPAQLALPAGLGDIAIGATAPLVALKLANSRHKKSFIFWQLLGITDLVTAVGTGVTAQLMHPQGIPPTPMTVLPMSLIPTFAVPLFMMLHFISIAQARKWREQPYARVGEPLQSSAL